jgi:hypothetical protein
MGSCCHSRRHTQATCVSARFAVQHLVRASIICFVSSCRQQSALASPSAVHRANHTKQNTTGDRSEQTGCTGQRGVDLGALWAHTQSAGDGEPGGCKLRGDHSAAPPCAARLKIFSINAEELC